MKSKVTDLVTITSTSPSSSPYIMKVTDLAMITPHVGTFDTAQRRVLNLLQNDAFPRFLRSTRLLVVLMMTIWVFNLNISSLQHSFFYPFCQKVIFSQAIKQSINFLMFNDNWDRSRWNFSAKWCFLFSGGQSTWGWLIQKCTPNCSIEKRIPFLISVMTNSSIFQTDEHGWQTSINVFCNV